MDADAGPSTKIISRLLWLPIVFAFVSFFYAVCISWHWPIVHDASIMHYVVFLMDHGMAPYRQINDINMPGAFIVEWLAVHIFGPGNLAWRVFDFVTMLVAIGACCIITRWADWRAGLLAGLLLGIAHMADGAIELGQRDWTILVMLLVAYTCLHLALDRRAAQQKAAHRSAIWMGAFAFVCGAATMVKPFVLPVPFVLLAVALLVLRRRGQRMWPYLAWSLTGAVMATAIFVAFLTAFHATDAFLEMMRGLLPFYAGIGNTPYTSMALMLGRVLLAWLLIALALSAVQGTWRRWQQQIVFAGILFGALFYFAQHKGFDQHRLTLLAFILLALCTEIHLALRKRSALRWFGAAALVFLLVYATAHWTRAVQHNTYDEGMLFSLQHDLEREGGASLSGNVQCIEMATGCITDLYRMRLVQSTGFISDIFLLHNGPAPPLDVLKQRFLDEVAAKPPRVIVIVASGFAGGRMHFEPIEDWPAFADWLKTHYSLKSQRLGADGTVQRGSYLVYRVNPRPEAGP